MPRVLVADALSEAGIDVLRNAGLEVDVKTGKTEDELVSIIKEYDALIVRSATMVTERLIAAADNLKLVGRAGVGVDNVDIPAASAKGIIVMNTPLGNITSAAEHALALLTTLARNVAAAAESMKSGKWNKKQFTGVELSGKLLGVIGMGKIGQIVSRGALGMGMKVVVYDPFLPERRAKELSVKIVELDELLATADFVTIHTPLTDKTRGLLNDDAFKKMKSSARLVNCARGGIVDEAAIVRALEAGEIAGAALDVFSEEPLPADSPLRSAPNIILTPHLGASTAEAQVKVAEAIAEQIASFFNEGKIQNALNLSVTLTPEIVPYADLAIKLGHMASQILSKPPQALTCIARGKIASGDIHALAVSALQGLLSNWSDQPVNLVNAPLVAEERGITVTEEKSLESPGYASYLKIRVETDDGAHTVAGTVFEGREPRIVEIDGFAVDLKPCGNVLVLFYPDRPGMVGRFGTILGNAGINIASMDVGRKEKHGRACVALSLDDLISEPVLKEIDDCTGEDGMAFLVNL